MNEEDETKPYQIRLSRDFWARVDEWRRQQPEIPTRAVAIRALVELGLAADERKKPRHGH